jgi:hypothetical protein
MDLQARKVAFIEDFIRVQSEKTILQFEKLLKKEVKNSQNEFVPMSIEQLIKRVDLSIEDSNNGKLTSNEALMDEIEKWN